MSVQHLSEIESSKRDPRLSSSERIADAMELAPLLVGVRMLQGDISLMTGDAQSAMKSYLKEAADSPAHWYQAGQVAFREGNFVSACTYVRRGIAANPYIAEGLTGSTKINEHLYWHASNRNGPEWATDYLSAPVCA